MNKKSIKKCTGKMEVFSRVVGYYRPVQFWNKGKKEEYLMRKTFKLDAEVVKEEPKNKDKSLFAVA